MIKSLRNFLLVFFTLFFADQLFAEGLNVNWQEIDEVEFQNISFPKDFLWGTATCEYQNSGAVNCPNCNWAQWEKDYDDNGNPRIVDNQKSGRSADHWNLYELDIESMKKLGLNSYRFSVDWSCVEPKKGEFNENALQHYVDVCKYIVSYNFCYDGEA